MVHDISRNNNSILKKSLKIKRQLNSSKTQKNIAIYKAGDETQES
jgi:hypothetical protein